jgi:hypothetical protein
MFDCAKVHMAVISLAHEHIHIAIGAFISLAAHENKPRSLFGLGQVLTLQGHLNISDVKMMIWRLYFTSEGWLDISLAVECCSAPDPYERVLRQTLVEGGIPNLRSNNKRKYDSAIATPIYA